METISQPAHPHLRRLMESAAGAESGVSDLVAPLTREQIFWKPAPERWSIAQCLDHLMVTGDQYYPRTRVAIDEARSRGLLSSAPYAPSFIGKRFLGAVGPVIRFRIKARPIFDPAPVPRPTVVDDFFMHRGTLLELIRDADGVDLRRGGTISSPLTRLLRFSIGECLEMLVVHEHRHLEQARRVVAEPGFPR